MEDSVSQIEDSDRDAARRNVMFGLLLTAAAYLAYANSFAGVFLLDDYACIVDNAALRSLKATWQASRDEIPGGLRRRDVGRWTFALNYAAGGIEPYGYHWVNLAIHIAAGLLLFGIVRRTLDLPRSPEYLRESSGVLAFVVALFWLLHPLQTESVTYIVQRIESLMGLFFLACLYFVIRAADCGPDASVRRRGFGALAVVSLALGLWTKEVMFVAPFVVACYDYVFLSRSLRKSLADRGALYISFAVLLVIYFASTLKRVPVSATNSGRPTSWEYLRSQPGVLLHYLKLTFWPDDLCLDYGWPIATDPLEIYGKGAVILVLLSIGAWLLWKRSWVGFLIIAFFLILAPTSTIVPLHLAFEHRMYLPLACIVALVVIAAFVAIHRLAGARTSLAAVLILPMTLAVAWALGAATYQRNLDYLSAERMWQDVVDKRPRNPRGLVNLGRAKALANDKAKAIEMFETAMRVKPTYSPAPYNYGAWLSDRWNEPEKAIPLLQKSIEIRPRESDYHFALGNALRQAKRTEEAPDAYRKALELNDANHDARDNLAMALRELGRYEEAESTLKEAVARNPDPWLTHMELARVCVATGRPSEALRHFDAAMRSRPDQPLLGGELAWLLATHPDEAVRDGQRAVRLAIAARDSAPDLHLVWDALAAAQAEVGEFNEAVKSAEQALSLVGTADEISADEMSDEIIARIELYRSAQPFRDVAAEEEQSGTEK